MMTLEQIDNHLNNMSKDELAYLHARLFTPIPTSARIISLANEITKQSQAIRRIVIQAIQARLGY